MQCQRHHDGVRKRILPPVVLLKSLLFGALSLTLVGCATTPYRWPQLTKANLPAKVSQIITEHGNLLDRRHRAGYGEWDVRATSEPPVATYACLPGDTCHIQVNKLLCTNAKVIKTECAVRLDVDKKVCRLMLPERNQNLSIRCPLDVVLVREKSALGSGAKTSPSKPTAIARF
jgi:hypothetical protein